MSSASLLSKGYEVYEGDAESKPRIMRFTIKNQHEDKNTILKHFITVLEVKYTL